MQNNSFFPINYRTPTLTLNNLLFETPWMDAPFGVCQYNNSKDKNRPVSFYSAEICEFAEREENCPNGDLCQKSHNRVEQLYRADKYKTKFCSFYPNYLEKCEYGIFCSFAHNENDILVELIHNLVYDDDFFMFKYKTVWCPFNLTQHDKSLCVYAHNWQYYRRSPHIYHY